jgi:myosin heavy chain 9/10/11/14
MVSNAPGIGSVRNNPFARQGSPSPAPGSNGRPKSAIYPSASPLSTTSTPPSHTRNQSHASIAGTMASGPSNQARHARDNSRGGTPGSGTFAPAFIKTEDMRRSIDVVKGIEGENDFSGKRYVWLKDPQAAFVKGWVVEELQGNRLVVQCDDGSVSRLSIHLLKINAELHDSSEKSTAKVSTRSIQPNLTRQTTWQSLRT